jgi:TolB protein
MDDEVQQTSQEAFDQIVLGLALIGLAGGAIAWVMDGFSSPWFLRSIALLLIILVAFILRRVGQFVIAAYVLVLELLGLVVGMFFEANTLTSFGPYLLIPIIIIANLILTPNVTIAVALFAMVLTLIIVLVTGELTLTNLLALLPPFGLSLLTVFLTTISSRHLIRLDKRLSESSKLLRERTLEWLTLREKVKELQDAIANLKEQLAKAKTETGLAQRIATQKAHRLPRFIQGTFQELKHSVRELEQVIETIAQIPQLDLQPNLLKEVWQRIDHLTSLVINMEELTQLENEELQLEYQTIEVSQFLDELVGAMRGLARAKNLELRCSIPESLPPLQADPVRLRQALLQVLGNAVKYTNQGVIEVQAELTERELLIFVSDTGVGMSAEAVEALFQDAVPGNQRQAKPQPNLGLGLKITQRLIELQGGRIWASSVPGVGSTFSIALPLQPAQIDLAATMVSAKPWPTVVTVEESSPTLVAGPALESELPELTSPAIEETMLSSSSPLRPAFAQTSGLTAAGNAQVSSPGPIQGSKQNGGLPHPQTSPSTAAKPAHQTTLPPVARFSPVYINRFSLTLLGMLLVIIVIVAILAWVNGPIQRKATATLRATSSVSSVSTGTLATQANLNPILTHTPAVLSQSTPTLRPNPTTPPTTTPSPSATATPIGARPPQEQINPAQEASTTSQPAQVTVTTSSTLQAGSETPTPTPTSSPMPAPALTPEPSRATVGPTPIVSPLSRPSPPDLSFVTSLRIAPAVNLLNFDAGSGIGLAAIADTTANSGLSWRAGQALFSGEVNGNRDIYLAQPGRNSPLNLTLAEGDDLQPAWSPDGRQIAFSSGRSGNLDIYVVNSQCILPSGGCDSKPTQLTTSRGFDEWPVWSPDSGKIAFVSDRDGNVEIYLMDANGNNQQRLTDHPADDWPAAWSPDGRRLVFASNRDGHWNLYVVEASGGEPARLTNDPADEREPVWSPDGRTIAFAYNGTGNWDIYTLPAPTSSVSETPRNAWTQITFTATDERNPTWLSQR